MTIGLLARRSGMTASTIRYYEQLGLLPAPIRMSGQRRYDETALQRLAVTRVAKYVGFSLEDIAQLLDGTRVRPAPERWRRMAHEKIGHLDALMSHASLLKRMLLETLSDKCPKLVERGSALNSV